MREQLKLRKVFIVSSVLRGRLLRASVYTLLFASDAFNHLPLQAVAAVAAAHLDLFLCVLFKGDTFLKFV